MYVRAYEPAINFVSAKSKEQMSQTSRLVWCMVKIGPIFCSLPNSCNNLQSVHFEFPIHSHFRKYSPLHFTKKAGAGLVMSDSPYTLHADSRDPSRFFYSYVMFCLFSGPLISLIDILNQLTCICDLCIFERSNIHRQRERIRHRLGLL